MRTAFLLTCTAAVAIAILVAGCGGSDKPAYCSDVSSFKTAVSDLKSTNVSQGASAVKSALQKVVDTGQTAVSSAKSDFPTETSAVSSSLSALSATIKQLGDPQTATAALKQVPAEVIAVNTAFQQFDSATSDKCD